MEPLDVLDDYWGEVRLNTPFAPMNSVGMEFLSKVDACV
jgi:hypothetical protein